MDAVEHRVSVPTGDATLAGDLTLPGPDPAIGVVVFAHGSGSGRGSPRNRAVAAALGGHRLATLLFDLLTEEEEVVDRRTGELRFDVGLLGRRLVDAVDWVKAQPATRGLPLGLFGASTGAAAALLAAAARPGDVAAVVSRGGRPDLAGAALRAVSAPTLLIVGGRDDAVLDLNREAQAALRGESALEVVPGAGHLFEEPGALERVAELAGAWFARYAGRQVAAPPSGGTVQR
jgi:putative phosphoribosyl transferase